ncbi:unnamed protein product, partial [Ectocarpus sp. 8 AP-2014]
KTSPSRGSVFKSLRGLTEKIPLTLWGVEKKMRTLQRVDFVLPVEGFSASRLATCGYHHGCIHITQYSVDDFLYNDGSWLYSAVFAADHTLLQIILLVALSYDTFFTVCGGKQQHSRR